MLKLILSLAVLVGAFVAVPAFADPHPKGFEPHPFNGSRQPVSEDGIVTFQIFDRECSNVDYGDGRGEFDCKNGNVRSNLSPRAAQRMGQNVDYRFDLWVDPSFSYPGYRNAMAAAFLPGAWDSYLRVASWEGNELHNFLYRLNLDATNGLTFLGQQCQAPESLGQWVSFSMKVRWSADSKGWIKVSCDDRVIYAAENVATDQAPHCYIRNQCEPGVEKHPSRITFLPGPVMQGHGHDWESLGETSPFIPIQPEGITVKMRNLEVAEGAVLYGPDDTEVVKHLQERLNALACDVGAVDGVAGRKTREAALGCRQFADGQLPDVFNVATARTFLELYSSPEAEGLPLGALPVKPDYRIRAAEDFSGNEGRQTKVVSKINGVIQREGKPDEVVGFGMIGLFDYQAQTFQRLELEFTPDLGKAGAVAVANCLGQRVETWDNGSMHLVMSLTRTDAGFVPVEGDCIIGALPRTVAAQAEFVLGHFREIAVSMVDGGTAAQIRNDGARIFIERAARGEVSIGR